MEREIIRDKIHNWYFDYSNDIFNYVFFIVGEREQAKDILQDTFIRAFNNFNSFDGRNAKSWLFRIARNLSIDHLRRKKPIRYFLDYFPLVTSNDPGPEQIAMLNETERQLYVSMSKLKRDYRDVIILRKIKEFSISESAQILGWKENKVKVTLFRAMKELKIELEKEGYTNETVFRRSE
ncbi:RNA polymerase sigma factor [Neobacillus sp. SCS-31]|uniref:RNA polymerase sigma factor n=1 Tax=Neobacillus oceani TaxID=3115292 RepID=UPI003906B4EB